VSETLTRCVVPASGFRRNTSVQPFESVVGAIRFVASDANATEPASLRAFVPASVVWSLRAEVQLSAFASASRSETLTRVVEGGHGSDRRERESAEQGGRQDGAEATPDDSHVRAGIGAASRSLEVDEDAYPHVGSGRPTPVVADTKGGTRG